MISCKIQRGQYQLDLAELYLSALTGMALHIGHNSNFT